MYSVRRVFSLLVMFILSSAISAQAVMWENLTFEQISFLYEDPDNNVEFSDRGLCKVEYGKDMDFGFLNVSAEIPGLSEGPVWIVRNLPMGDDTMGPPDEIVSYQFPLSYLGVEDGMPAPPIEFGYTITPESMSDDEMPVFLATVPRMHMAPVMQTQRNANQGVEAANAEEKTGDPVLAEYVPFTGSPGHSVTTWMGCNMPNIPLNSGTMPMDASGCAPASCANSMAWLDQQHPEIDVPDSLRVLFRELSNLMNRAQGKGASNETMARAKLDFIEAHNLPIHVKLQSWGSSGDISSSSGASTATDAGGDANDWPTAEWLKSETQKGEDVEVLVTYMYKDATGWHSIGGHAVVVSGMGTVRGWDWITWKHDTSQGDATGTEQEVGILHDTGDGIIIVGMGFKYKPKGSTTEVKVEAYMDGVLSESFDNTVTPPPAEETFDDYCDYITRTIKPGGTLTLEFPEDSDRSMDVTVHQVDRHKNPPTQRALWRWTNNSGKSRTLNNPTNVCITVKIHNDDMDGDYWGIWYDDYTVQISQTKSAVSPDPSNFEETGGFSLGGRDSYCEFGPAIMPSMVVDYTPEILLDTVPSSLGSPGGTYEVFLNCQIPAWNKFWTQLGFIVDVLDVTTPGDLLVDCPINGFSHVLNITGPGRYKVLLGDFAPAPDFSLRLEAMPGLEFTLDAIGVPTVVDFMSPVSDEDTPPAMFLAVNHPNPFNPITTIRFGLGQAGAAELAIYDLQGHRVAVIFSGQLGAGSHQRSWSGVDDAGRSVAAGTYVYRLVTGEGILTRKMTLVK
ncbi:MAG: T9SS type A sorting domain-containing protein [Gemmatimonadales bacterium]|nr:T9SS type A sorting domain-containing protein [Gemmatimonadales bacterium]